MTDAEQPRPRRRSASRPAGPPEPTGSGDPTPDRDPAATAAANYVPADPVEADDRRRSRRQRSRQRRAERGTPGDAPVMPPPRSQRQSRGDDSDSAPPRGRGERHLRGLEATRGTQVSPTAALRARDWAAPSDDDFAEAEREVVLVRRNYVPPAPLQTGRRRGRPRD